MKTNCIVILAACFVGPLFVVFAIFDAVLRRQYEWARAAWERDGSPRGYFWYPPGHFFAGSMRRDVVLQSWIFKTPNWARNDTRFQKLFRSLRWSVAAWAVIATAGVIGTFILCR